MKRLWIVETRYTGERSWMPGTYRGYLCEREQILAYRTRTEASKEAVEIKESGHDNIRVRLISYDRRKKKVRGD
jgi:hypothetical protein